VNYFIDYNYKSNTRGPMLSYRVFRILIYFSVQ